MKNLQDELKKLGDEDFKVSSDFSKNVISKIKRNNNLTVLKNVTSAFAVVCASVLVVVVTTKTGLIDKAVSSASMSVSNVNPVEELTKVGSQINKEEITSEGSSSNTTYYNDQSFEDEPNINTRLEVSDNSSFDFNNATPEAAQVVDSTFESDFFDGTIEESNDSSRMKSAKTYSKQMELDEYINEIHKSLDSNKIENKIISDNKIEIYSDNIDAIYKVIDVYIDAKLEVFEDKIVLTIE